MQALINFFTSLGNVVVSLVEFVIKFIKDLFYIIGLLGNLIVSLPSMIGWLPSACISLTVTAFSIVVIYKIMGREG